MKQEQIEKWKLEQLNEDLKKEEEQEIKKIKEKMKIVYKKEIHLLEIENHGNEEGEEVQRLIEKYKTQHQTQLHSHINDIKSLISKKREMESAKIKACTLHRLEEEKSLLEAVPKMKLVPQASKVFSL